ncbi:MAG: AAA family ATPase [Cyanobacteria bacterium MAG CAR3_bin_5]|nr:AAA family ATPase [Cyanobacteria bacterium MAG CAR3_bin_5]
MLLALKLDNVALIDALDLEFSPGLTVLTGETGAGKSLLLDSLEVLLGAEVPRRLLRHGQDQARIEGRFAPHGGASRLLEQRGLGALGPPPSALVVTRHLFRRGGRISSRGRINGISINRQTLLELRPLLIDLTVQGQTQRLGRPSQQRRWLDGFGDGSHQQARRLVAAAYQTWVRHRAALDRLKAERTALQQSWRENTRMLMDLRQAALEDPQELATLKWRIGLPMPYACNRAVGRWCRTFRSRCPVRGRPWICWGRRRGSYRVWLPLTPPFSRSWNGFNRPETRCRTWLWRCKTTASIWRANPWLWRIFRSASPSFNVWSDGTAKAWRS